MVDVLAVINHVKRNGIKNVGIGILPQSGQKVVASKRGVVEAVSAPGRGKCTAFVKAALCN